MNSTLDGLRKKGTIRLVPINGGRLFKLPYQEVDSLPLGTPIFRKLYKYMPMMFNTYHVGIYVGDSMVIDATGAKHCAKNHIRVFMKYRPHLFVECIPPNETIGKTIIHQAENLVGQFHFGLSTSNLWTMIINKFLIFNNCRDFVREALIKSNIDVSSSRLLSTFV